MRGKKKERYRQVSKLERSKHLHLNLPNNERHTALEKRKDVGPDRTLKEKCLDDIMILNVNRSSKSRYSSKMLDVFHFCPKWETLANRLRCPINPVIEWPFFCFIRDETPFDF